MIFASFLRILYFEFELYFRMNFLKKSMIKQSDICNYVSLIKSLKDEDCFHKIYTGYEPIYSNFFTRKNSLGANAYSKKMNNSKSRNQFSKTINFPSSKLDIKNQSAHFTINRKKNIFDIHHEQKKKREQKIYVHQYPNANYYVKNILFNDDSRQIKKKSYLDDTQSFVSENKIKFQRANTGQSNSPNKFLNYTVEKIDKSQDLSIKTLEKRRINGNTSRNLKSKQNNMKRFQSMKNSGRSSPQQLNPPIEKLRQITKRMRQSKMKLASSLTQDSNLLLREAWVIDPWEHPLDSRQQLPSSRYK